MDIYIFVTNTTIYIFVSYKKRAKYLPDHLLPRQMMVLASIRLQFCFYGLPNYHILNN